MHFTIIYPDRLGRYHYEIGNAIVYWTCGKLKLTTTENTSRSTVGIWYGTVGSVTLRARLIHPFLSRFAPLNWRQWSCLQKAYKTSVLFTWRQMEDNTSIPTIIHNWNQDRWFGSIKEHSMLMEHANKLVLRWVVGSWTIIEIKRANGRLPNLYHEVYLGSFGSIRR